MTGLDPLLEALPRWTLVGGKGGVGKTTCAAALASASARGGDATLLLSTDPARSLGDALGVPLGPEPRAVAERPGLEAFQLDATTARDAFLARWRETLITIVDRGTYLEVEDIAALIDAALPGADEAMALLTLADLERSSRWTRIIVDTAPTGHTLRLLSLPDTFRALVDLLDRMQDKHRFMVSALTHRYRPDAADAFIAEMREQLDQLAAVLRDRTRAAVLLVTRPEPVVAAETVRYLDTLPALGLTTAGLVLNACDPGGGAHGGDDAEDGDRSEALSMIAAAVREHGLEITMVPVMEQPPIGLEGIDAWGELARPLGSEALEHLPSRTTSRARSAPRSRTSPDDPGWLDRLPHAGLRARALTIVGGKGGVGKTTVACALAILTAREDAPVLLVSTDPAPSIADALAQPIGDDEIDVKDVPGLVARQMDASAAFDRLRTAYMERIDEMFDSLVSGGLDASHDRRIVRELLALAPPGIDELYALASLGETLESSRFQAVVVDPAPTGHLLRLLEMPALAIDWSHRLMRLMLKYKELASFGEVGQELLSFARRTRALQALLTDPGRAGLLVVALDEPLVRAETIRLTEAARTHGVDVMGVLWNRAQRRPSPLPASAAARQFVGEPVAPPPRGAATLRAWGARWRILHDEHG